MQSAKVDILKVANSHFRNGDYEKAINLYRSGVGNDGKIDFYRQNLILALRAASFLKEASQEIYRGLAENPKDRALNSFLEHQNRSHIKNHNGPTLSVIVPVYNSGKYLEKCLQSILDQTFEDLELLVINDGSTDDCGEIIRKLEMKDSRIKVISNERPSGNPGTPRNQALALAEGAYIGFVDSDDWIEPDFYQVLLDKAGRCYSDIVFSSGFNNHTEKGMDIRKYGNSGFNDSSSRLFKYHESFMIWDKIFSKKMIDAFDLRLGETKAAVDVPFIFKAYYYAHRVSFCDDYIGYNYRRESDSSVTVNYRKSSDCNFELSAYQAIENWIVKEKVKDYYGRVVAYKKVSSFIYTLSVIAPKMFDKFYEKAKLIFGTVDREIVKEFCEFNGKNHILKKYDAVISKSPTDYKKEYRSDISKKSASTKTQQSAIEKKQTFHIAADGKGVMFFPDWSARNPYQKLLYAAISKKYNSKVKGYSEKLFCPELLSLNSKEFGVVHLHWLHVFMDFTKETGADEFIEKLKSAKAHGYTIVYTAHNIISHDSEYIERERKFRRLATRYFDHILVHGEYAKDRIVNEIGVDPDKVSVVPHGSYEGYYPNYVDKTISRNRFDIKEEDFVFLFFGNIKGYKGVDQLLESYRRVSQNIKNTRLIIAGRVFEKATGELIESYANHDKSIIFHPGFIQESDAQYYFNAADIVVLPYKRILTSGAALLSFSFSKPIIAPNSGLLPELVTSPEQGFLFSSYEEMENLMLGVAKSGFRDSDPKKFQTINKSLRWSALVADKPFNNIFPSYALERKQSKDFNKSYEVALIRILGNDLPFRHNQNQTLANLDFTLENESDFEGCVKIWILNRIIDRDKKNKIISLLEKYNKKYIDIPYQSEELAKAAFCFDDLPVDEYTLTTEYEKLSERNKVIVDTAILKHKNNYVMNNNGARNVALEEGKKIAKWVLPWDGNCFLNDQAWLSLTASLAARSDIQYHIVPMDRIVSNQAVIEEGYSPNPSEEPQIVFRSDAELNFDERLMYGLKPKVDLLKRLGVPGVWDNWNNLYPWKKHEVEFTKDSLNYVWSGWVARLFSGNEGQELSAHERAVSREKGIVKYIRHHDIAETFKRFNKKNLAYYDESLIDQLRKNPDCAGDLGLLNTLKKLKENAEEYIENPLYSVIHKTTLPPSQDLKDYWHPAPYAWPNPDTADGLPYVHKDGQRVPGTRMYEAESVKYDRTSIQRLFDETTALSLAGYIYNKTDYLKKAYDLIHCWFIRPETAMNPNLNFSQVVLGKNNNKGTASGLIETKDLYFLLDAIRIVKRTDYWTSNDDATMNKWCRDFIDWLCTSEQGIQESKAKNNHGNAYDLQVYALAAFIGDIETMYDIIIRASSRLKSHVDSDGRQPHELKRTTTAHYTSFNLHLWISLHSLIKNTSKLSIIDTNQNYGADGYRSALKVAASWVLRHGILPKWPFKQIDHFDKARYEHIYHSLAPSSPNLERKYKRYIKSFSDAKDVYFPHDGIAPYWKLSINKTYRVVEG
ncbi:alginate lyase family protein [Marinobacterium sp. YM272]|uniref:alginate lyase family protein n=1 Tax=Marinobacterium sp. YM272 TaxID=3421654 RepID=UPI003D7F8AD7